MYTKTVTYKDFLGNQRTDSFSFNMTEVELMKWASQPGNYSKDQVIEKMINERNNEGLMDLVESLLKASYGEISLDGIRFVKTPEIQDKFFESNAYPALFLELATDPDEASRFFDEIFPDNIDHTLAKLKAAAAARKARAEISTQTEPAANQVSGS